MLKTWFKSAIPFSEEELSLLNQKGFKPSEDKTSASLQDDGSTVGNSESGWASSYVEKSITKYSGFYVAKKQYQAESTMGFEPTSDSKTNEEDFPSLDEAISYTTTPIKF
jgi:hypothetical protein